MNGFAPCLDISEVYFREIVRPIIEENFPGLRYTAALIGSGSEVLGLDTEISSDHDWAPRTFIFLSDSDYLALGRKIEDVIIRERPKNFKGYSFLDTAVSSDIRARIVFSVNSYWEEYLGIKATADISCEEWLTFPQHRLLGMVSGKVYHNQLDDFSRARIKFSYYPDEVWFYMLASQWKKIAEEQPFLGRYIDLNDELGFRIMLAKLSKDVMRLHYLIKRIYFPYNKWFTVYYKNKIGDVSLLLQSLQEADLRKAEGLFFENLQRVAEDFNKIGIVHEIKASIGTFHTRPYRVINADDYVENLKEKLRGGVLEKIPLYGAMDQWVDSVLMNESYRSAKKLQSSFNRF